MLHGLRRLCGKFRRHWLKVVIFLILLQTLTIVLDVYDDSPAGLGSRGIAPVQSQPLVARPDKRTPYSPYFHQVFFGYSPMPSYWNKSIGASRKMNRDIQYRLWSASDAHALISKDFPWFVETYDGYAYDIQRVDAVRYFILYRYGGFYIDMDVQAKFPFTVIIEELNGTNYDCIFPETSPMGVSNDLMMCKAGAPFLEYAIHSLASSDHWYGLPYVTVMASTGPLFLSKCLWLYGNKQEIKILPTDLYTKKYFGHWKGSTWHSWDGRLIYKVFRSIKEFKWTRKNLVSVLIRVAAILLVTSILVVLWRKLRQRNNVFPSRILSDQRAKLV